MDIIHSVDKKDFKNYKQMVRKYAEPLLRPSFVVVERVSFGFFYQHEADLIICSKAGYLTEVEIKLSFSDWKNDFKKDKWKSFPKDWGLIKEFWYLAPLSLSKRYTELPIPEWAGIIGSYDYYTDCRFEIIRYAKTRDNFRALNEQEMLKLARLGSMRAWKEKPIWQDLETKEE